MGGLEGCQASPALPVWESTVPSVLPRMSLAGQRDLEVLQLHPGDNSPAGPASGRAAPAPGAARRETPMPRPFLAPLSTYSLTLLWVGCPAIKPSTLPWPGPISPTFSLLWGHGGAAHWEVAAFGDWFLNTLIQGPQLPAHTEATPRSQITFSKTV